MKAAVGLIGVLVLVCICIPACIFLGTLWQKTSSVPGGSSVAEERREAGRKAPDGQHDVTVPVAVSVADCKPVTGSDGHSDRMIRFNRNFVLTPWRAKRRANPPCSTRL